MWRRNRGWILLFTVWFAVSPLALTVAQANDLPDPGASLPQPEVTTTALPSGVVPIDQIMTPSEYLRHMIELRRGLDQQQIKDRAWADWCMTMGQIYATMGEESHDVFSFYHTAHAVKSTWKAAHVVTETPTWLKGMTKAADFCAFLFAFLGKGKIGTFGTNMFTGLARNFTKASKGASKLIHGNHALEFIEHMAPPPCWNNPKVAGEGFKSYMRWVRRVTHTESKAQKGKFVLKNSKGVARSIGIGLTVLGVALDVYHLSTSDDTHGGRWQSYDTVKTIISGTLGCLILAAMFIPPPFGQIVQIGALIWFVCTLIGDAIGSYTRRWREAYRNSYWFLHEADPAFRSFYENRQVLKRDEKAASLILAEQKVRDVLASQTPQTDEEKKDWQRGMEVFEGMEKQGVLMSYYARGNLRQPAYDRERLLDLWKKKADFMSWKPTEPEADAAKDRGFWGSVWHAVNPMTYVAWAGDKIKSRGFNKELKKEDMPRVWFNPDFVLFKRFQSYLMMTRSKGPLYDTLALRIEQAPFNYIPLVDVDTSLWDETLLTEGYMADAFITGQKEMVSFREMAKAATAEIKKAYKDMKARLKDYKNRDIVEEVKERAEVLKKLGEAYRDAPDTACDAVFADLRRVFGWTWPSNGGPKTPKAIVQQYKPYIAQALELIPVTNGMQNAEFLLMKDTLNANMNTAAIMREFGEKKMASCKAAAGTFTNEKFRKYICEGAFLGVKGGGLSNWLAEIYPAQEEMRKYTDLYLDEVGDYEDEVKDFANSDLGRIIRETNDNQVDLKDVIELWDSIKDQTGVEVVLDPNAPAGTPEQPKPFDGTFPPGGLVHPGNLPDGIEVLDPTQPIGGVGDGNQDIAQVHPSSTSDLNLDDLFPSGQ